MGSVIERKKADKRKRLLEAAYNCFKDKGFAHTSISDICEKAEVAKGTFYLYFKDKEEIIHVLSKRLASDLLDSVLENVRAENERSFAKILLKAEDHVIEYFRSDLDRLRVIRREFTWPLTIEEFMNSSKPSAIRAHRLILEYAKRHVGEMTVEGIYYRITILLSAVASTCYAAWIDHNPDDQDKLRECLDSIIINTFPD